MLSVSCLLPRHTAQTPFISRKSLCGLVALAGKVVLLLEEVTLDLALLEKLEVFFCECVSHHSLLWPRDPKRLRDPAQTAIE